MAAFIEGCTEEMIFNVPGHIDMIRNGLRDGQKAPFQVLPTYPAKLIPEEVVKTQTRRLNRGIYKVGKDYAVQRKRGVKAEPDIRIVMDRIWEEEERHSWHPYISKKDAWVEGGYMPEDYEKAFKKAYPKWNGFLRWAFEFHVIEV